MKFIISLSVSTMFIIICILICKEMCFDFHTISISTGWFACLIHRSIIDWLNKRDKL